MKRKFNAFSKSKTRKSRPAKLRQIKRDTEEEIASYALPSASIVSPQTEDGNQEQGAEQERDASALTPQLVQNVEEAGQCLRSLSPQASVGDPAVEAFPDTATAFGDNQKGNGTLVADAECETEEASNVNEAQLRREQVYYAFAYEDPSDYTKGPCRMVEASDGVREDCVALLMTPSLSAKIQETIKAQREFAKIQRSASSKKRSCLRFRSRLDTEITSRKSRRKKATESDAQLHRLEEELRRLERMLEGTRVEEQLIKNDVEYQGKRLRAIQEQASAEIEDAFIHARLLGPLNDTPDTPIEDRDLQQEYQKFVNEENGVDNGSPTPGSPLDTSSDYLYSQREPLTPEQQREQVFRNALWAAQKLYDSAQNAFDRRESDRLEEYSANAEAAARGEATRDASPEDFDLRWVQKIQELTRELIEAESALSAAKAAAVEGGIDVPMDDRASGFLDDVADGYRMSVEQTMIGSVPSPKIRNWMSGIPERAPHTFNENSNEADEWEAEDVEISDSVSMVAQDAGERRRIDQWRQVCGL